LQTLAPQRGSARSNVFRQRHGPHCSPRLQKRLPLAAGKINDVAVGLDPSVLAEVKRARWPKPLKELKAATFNARVETVADKPMFRDAFRRTRCVIPASGYYEWQDTPEGKQPHYFTRRDGQPITFAGLWALWRDKQAGETVKSCAMIITDANEFVAEVHDRMPVILEPDQHEPWLTGNAGVQLIKPAANDLLQRWPVSKRVNSSRADADDATPIDPLTGGDPDITGAGLFA
jgi:putative SOS response-associated peptidase YedK